MIIKNNKGLSIMEVVIGALILAVAFIPVMRMISNSAVGSVKIGNKAKAADVMTILMEELKNTPFRLYEEKMPELVSDTTQEWQDLTTKAEDFYPDTLKMLNELKSDKEYWVGTAKARASHNNYKQIIELELECEINWKEKGSKGDDAQRDQSLRDHALLFNSDAKLD